MHSLLAGYLVYAPNLQPRVCSQMTQCRNILQIGIRDSDWDDIIYNCKLRSIDCDGDMSEVWLDVVTLKTAKRHIVQSKVNVLLFQALYFDLRVLVRSTHIRIKGDNSKQNCLTSLHILKHI